MRIGVDATCWQNKRGYGRHARALLSTLIRLDAKNDYTFLMDSHQEADTFPAEAKTKVVGANQATVEAAAADGYRSPGDMWRMSRALSSSAFDLVLFPTIYSYVPIFSQAKKVVIIHDIIAETYPQLTLPNRTARIFWKIKVALGRRQADAIATVSDYSRQGIIEYFNVAPERVFTVTEASDPIFQVLDNPLLTPALKQAGITECDNRYVVYVGGFGPHKNLNTLVTVFAQLAAQPEYADAKLVLVGKIKGEAYHTDFIAIKEQAMVLGIEDRIIFTDFLPDEELVVLLNLATVLVLPSLMEGFGLPAVEAAACGCPVIATTASPLPSLLNEGGLYINPTNPQELLQALAQVLGSIVLQQHMRQAGLTAARKLTWDAAAQQMITLIDKVISQ